MMNVLIQLRKGRHACARRHPVGAQASQGVLLDSCLRRYDGIRRVHGMRSFTLVELVVAMGVIAVVGALTLVAVRQVSRNTRQASGVNAVMAALDNARSIAMKENKIILVVFRPRLDGPNKMYVEAVLAEWTGQTASMTYSFGANPSIVDRFVPVQDIVPRRLPSGIKVAAPKYGTSTEDNRWQTQPHLPQINQATGSGEPFGVLAGVMYAPDGATTSRNSRTDSHFIFVDFNNDGLQTIATINYSYTGAASNFPNLDPDILYGCGFDEDESMVSIAPFIAVYDDDEARSLARGTWLGAGVGASNFVLDVTGPTGYISSRADRIHFNRYTGVAMK